MVIYIIAEPQKISKFELFKQKVIPSLQNIIILLSNVPKIKANVSSVNNGG